MRFVIQQWLIPLVVYIYSNKFTNSSESVNVWRSAENYVSGSRFNTLRFRYFLFILAFVSISSSFRVWVRVGIGISVSCVLRL